MDKNHEILKKLHQEEVKAGLYNIELHGTPLWRIVRFKYRVEFLHKRTGFTNKSEGFTVSKLELLKYFFISFFQFSRLLLFPKKAKNVVFAFPRLYKVGEQYIDKFSDPVIEFSDLKEDCLIFQHSFGRPHNKPRANKVVYGDFIDIFSRFLAVLFCLFYYLVNKRIIESIYLKIEDIYGDSKYSKLSIVRDILVFKISNLAYSLILRKIKTKNVFIVNRQVFNFVVFASKKLKIRVFEFQHGITQNETALYTGVSQLQFDPNYFLCFGEAWVNDFYGIPKDQIFNIGWAYSDYVSKSLLLDEDTRTERTFLVISSPAITQNILEFVMQAKKEYPTFNFNIRLHPQEKLNSDQLSLISNCNGVEVIDNSVESVFSIANHRYVLGDNSSVLYEALSMGKLVGKINAFGMYSRNIEEDRMNGFFIVRDMIDLKTVIEGSVTGKNEYYYSSFRKDILNQLIK